MSEKFRSAWGSTKDKIVALYKAIASGNVEYKIEDLVELQAVIDRILKTQEQHAVEVAHPEEQLQVNGVSVEGTKMCSFPPLVLSPDAASDETQQIDPPAHCSKKRPLSKEEQEVLNEAYIRCKKGHEKLIECAQRLSQQLHRKPYYIRLELTPRMRSMHMSREQLEAAAEFSRPMQRYAMLLDASSEQSSTCPVRRTAPAAAAVAPAVAASRPSADTNRHSSITEGRSASTGNHQSETASDSSTFSMSAVKSSGPAMLLSPGPICPSYDVDTNGGAHKCARPGIHALTVAELHSLNAYVPTTNTTAECAMQDRVSNGPSGVRSDRSDAHSRAISERVADVAESCNDAGSLHDGKYIRILGALSRKRRAAWPAVDATPLRRARKPVKYSGVTERSHSSCGRWTSNRPRYTAEDDAAILQARRDYAQTGKTWTLVSEELAESLGRSVSSIANRVYRLTSESVGANGASLADISPDNKQRGSGSADAREPPPVSDHSREFTLQVQDPGECESLSSFGSASIIPIDEVPAAAMASKASVHEGTSSEQAAAAQPIPQSSAAPTHAPAGLGMDPSISNRRGMPYTAAEDDAILEAYWAGAQAGKDRTQVAAETAARLGRDPTGVERRYRELAYYRNAW